MSTQRILKQASVEETDKLPEPPKMYRVLLHNDHFTTMEFVVNVLKEVFRKTRQEAVQIMLDVHKEGRGIVGIYSYDVARTKVDLVRRRARLEEFPLKCTCEQA